MKCENTECIYLLNTENKLVVKCEQQEHISIRVSLRIANSFTVELKETEYIKGKKQEMCYTDSLHYHVPYTLHV
jgi:hypothetical protein